MNSKQVALHISNSDDSGEELITDMIYSIMQLTLDDVRRGEIAVGEDRKVHRADIVSENSSIAVECKGDRGHLMGISQALSYNSFGYSSYVACYNMSDTVKSNIKNTPVKGINLNHSGSIEVINEETNFTKELDRELDLDRLNSKLKLKQKYDVLLKSIPDRFVSEKVGDLKMFDPPTNLEY
jgi:hypothetical protein